MEEKRNRAQRRARQESKLKMTHTSGNIPMFKQIPEPKPLVAFLYVFLDGGIETSGPVDPFQNVRSFLEFFHCIPKNPLLG